MRKIKNLSKKTIITGVIILSFGIGATAFASVQYIWKNNVLSIRNSLDTLADRVETKNNKIKNLAEQTRFCYTFEY